MHVTATRIRPAFVVVAAAALLAGAPAAAQPGPPVFTAPPGSLQARPSAQPPVDPRQLAQEAIDLYRLSCAQAPAERAALVDRALAVGLQRYEGEGDAGARALLGGRAGQVYAPPARAALLQLALGDDGRCTVWAQGALGPAVKAGFLALVEDLRGQGAAVRGTRDEVVERAGGWRQHSGFEVADAGRGRRAFDAVTLVSEQPGVQVLSTAPLGAPSAAQR